MPSILLTWTIIIFVIRVFVLTSSYSSSHYIQLWDYFSHSTAPITALCLKPSPCLIVKSSFLSLAFKILSELASAFVLTLVFNHVVLAASTLLTSWTKASLPLLLSYSCCPSEIPPSSSNPTCTSRPSISSLQPLLPRNNFSQFFLSVSI